MAHREALPPDSDAAAFVDGDLAWLTCVDVPDSTLLRTEGVQLVKHASVLDDNAFQLYQMVTGPFATAVRSGEALVLLGLHEQFLSLATDGTIQRAAPSPDAALRPA